jgi:hypothetical protein
VPPQQACPRTDCLLNRGFGGKVPGFFTLDDLAVRLSLRKDEFGVTSGFGPDNDLLKPLITGKQVAYPIVMKLHEVTIPAMVGFCVLAER